MGARVPVVARTHGPFIEELKDVSLKFRGSSNQRILKLPRQGLPSILHPVA